MCFGLAGLGSSILRVPGAVAMGTAATATCVFAVGRSFVGACAAHVIFADEQVEHGLTRGELGGALPCGDCPHGSLACATMLQVGSKALLWAGEVEAEGGGEVAEAALLGPGVELRLWI